MGIWSQIKGMLGKIFRDDTSERLPFWADAGVVDINAEIDQVRSLLHAARNNFNFVTDPDVIEYYIYLQKAYEIRYDMLVRRLKARHEELTEEA